MLLHKSCMSISHAEDESTWLFFSFIFPFCSSQIPPDLPLECEKAVRWGTGSQDEQRIWYWAQADSGHSGAEGTKSCFCCLFLGPKVCFLRIFHCGSPKRLGSRWHQPGASRLPLSSDGGNQGGIIWEWGVWRLKGTRKGCTINCVGKYTDTVLCTCMLNRTHFSLALFGDRVKDTKKLFCNATSTVRHNIQIPKYLIYEKSKSFMQKNMAARLFFTHNTLYMLH